jgi:hypothetical protein
MGSEISGITCLVYAFIFELTCSCSSDAGVGGIGLVVFVLLFVANVC